MNAPLPDKADHGPDRNAGDHWRRFRQLMVLMTILAFATAGVVIWQIRADGGPFRLHYMLALGGGIVITLLLAGLLMGLAFVSNRSGHDDSVAERDPDSE